MQRTAQPRSCCGYHPGEVWLFPDADMTPSETNYSAASFGGDGKQLVHARHNRSCNQVSWIQLHCFKKLSSSMSSTSGVNHSRTADLIVCGCRMLTERSLFPSRVRNRGVP